MLSSICVPATETCLLCSPLRSDNLKIQIPTQILYNTSTAALASYKHTTFTVDGTICFSSFVARSFLARSLSNSSRFSQCFRYCHSLLSPSTSMGIDRPRTLSISESGQSFESWTVTQKVLETSTSKTNIFELYSSEEVGANVDARL